MTTTAGKLTFQGTTPGTAATSTPAATLAASSGGPTGSQASLNGLDAFLGALKPDPPPTNTPLLPGSGQEDAALNSYSQDLNGIPIATEASPGAAECGHMFFSTQVEANKPDSGIARNARGDADVGFLHLPDDPYVAGGMHYSEDDRQAQTRQVVGAAIQGYYQDASRAAGDGPVKLQLNGYGPFADAQDNPSGDFVGHASNVDAAMQAAFGENLLTPQGTVVQDGVSSGKTYAYQVKDPSTGTPRDVQIHAGQYNVDSSAFNGEAGSVQDTMKQFKPQAVLSMGYNAGQSDYIAEHEADDRGIAANVTGGYTEAFHQATTHGFNYSLEQALQGYKPGIR